MKIFVTGVAGAIGSHVAEALVRSGHEVIGIDSFTPYYARAYKDITVADIKKRGVQFHELDLATDDIEPLLKGVEVIYHFAAQPGISSAVPFSDYVRNNIIAEFREETVERAESDSNFRVALLPVFNLHQMPAGWTTAVISQAK